MQEIITALDSIVECKFSRSASILLARSHEVSNGKLCIEIKLI